MIYIYSSQAAHSLNKSLNKLDKKVEEALLTQLPNTAGNTVFGEIAKRKSK